MACIALATCREWPLPEGDAPLRRCLEARGHTVHSVPWDAERAPFLQSDLIVIRACWDYYKAPEAFLAWIDALDARAAPVHNRPDVIRWNFDKKYLLELQALGIATPETLIVDPRDHPAILEEMRRRGWTQAVRKPISGQSGHHVERLDASSPAAWPKSAMATPKALLQEYQPQIGRLGETMLVFLGGRFSHAVRRVIPPDEWRSNSQFGSYRERCAVSAAIVAQAGRALTVLDEPPLYARVDGIVDGERFLLMELELVEPDLGLREVPEAAERFADEIEALLASAPGEGG